jgi:hypothetical protein
MLFDSSDMIVLGIRGTVGFNLFQGGMFTLFAVNRHTHHRYRYLPRRRNLWITDTLQWAPETRLAQLANQMWESATSAFALS